VPWLTFLKTTIGKWLVIIGAALAAALSLFIVGKRKAHKEHKAESAELQADVLKDLREVEKKHREEDDEKLDSVGRGDRDHLDNRW